MTTPRIPTDNIDPKHTQLIAEASDSLDTALSPKPKSQTSIVLERFLRHRAAMVSLIILTLIIILAFTSIGFAGIPGWWKYSYQQQPPILGNGKPTLGFFRWGDHPFGQDNVGTDYFALTMRGTQQSIKIAFMVGIIATLTGTTIGALAGYFRGILETLLMRVTDVFMTIPLLALAATLSSISPTAGIVMIGVVIGLSSWTSLARLVRGEFLLLREREFVEAARVGGSNGFRIIFRHILPNTIGVIVVSTTLSIAAAILLETSLSYLGVGVRAPDTSLGLLITQYQAAFTTRPWLFWWPGLFIVVIALCVNFIGDGLRDAYDPRQRKMPKIRRFFGLLPARKPNNPRPGGSTPQDDAAPDLPR